MANEKVLIVDDEKDMLQVINDVLSIEGYAIINADSGELALKILEQEKVDLILLDLNMPGIGGYEVCRRVKKLSNTKLTPIIIVSSNSQEVDKIAALGLGAVDYVTKPFSPGELRARVRTQLKLKSVQDDLLKQKSIMSKLAVHDELTGLYNRRYLISRMDEETVRAARYHSPLACMIMDIDDFKRINDTHGHSVGDLILVDLSNLLKDFVRETDVVARYGGEEFIILLPETDVPGAVTFAERLLERVRKNIFAEQTEKLHITVSIGVSGNQNIETDRQKILDAADKFLYQAKSDGKNCVRSQQV